METSNRISVTNFESTKE